MSRRMVAPGVWADEGPRPAVRHGFTTGGPIDAAPITKGDGKNISDRRRSQVAAAQQRYRERHSA